MIHYDIILTVIGTSLIQSIFGVGVLLFGTPILLALGYDFINAITILLPISLLINLIQIVKDFKKINIEFYKNIIIFTIPLVVLFLFFITTFTININLMVGVFLLVVAIKDYSLQLKKVIEYLTKHEKIFLMTMGILHGATNLGGSLLTALVHTKKYEKTTARVTVAASYATFAVFQIATLLFSAKLPDFKLRENALYLTLGTLVFLISEATIYKEINNQKYSNYFALFLFGAGILLCYKSI